MNSGPWKTRRWITADPHGSAHTSVKMPSVPGSQCGVLPVSSLLWHRLPRQSERARLSHPLALKCACHVSSEKITFPPALFSNFCRKRNPTGCCLLIWNLSPRPGPEKQAQSMSWQRVRPVGGWPGITVYQPWPVPTHVRFLSRCLKQHWNRASPGHFLTFERGTQV